MARRTATRGINESTRREVDALRAFLSYTGGATKAEIANNFGWSDRKVARRISHLREVDKDDPPYSEQQAGTRELVWRPGARMNERQDIIDMSRGHRAVVMFLVLKVVRFLEGTGFAEELEDLTRELGVILHHEEKDLENMFHFIQSPSDAPYVEYTREKRKKSRSSILDSVKDVVDAILSQRQLSVRHTRVANSRRPFRFDPHTLCIYKSGLYVAGFNHHDKAIDGFPLDEFESIDVLPGTFKRQRGYSAAKIYKNRFGIHGGEKTKVRIFFPDSIELGGRVQAVAKYVRRRRIHPSQTIREVAGGIETTLQVEGTTELKPWIRSWPGARILEPESLSEELLEEHVLSLEREGWGAIDFCELATLDHHARKRRMTRESLVHQILSEWLSEHPLRRS